MEEFQSWLTSSPTIISTACRQDEETQSTLTLCEDRSSSFVSIKTKTPQIINCLAVRDNTLYAATTTEINVLDPKTLTLVDTFGPGSGWAKSIAFGGGDDDQRKIFTAHQDCKIRVWRRQQDKQKHYYYRLISTLPTFKDRVFNCLSPRNDVKISRLEHADAVSALAVDSDAGLMYSVSWDKCLKLWKISSSVPTRCLESITVHSDAVNAIVISPLDRTVYTGSADGEIKIWRTTYEDTTKRHCKLLNALTKHESSVNALALAEKGSVLCSGGGDGVILVWERDEKISDYDFYVGCCLEGHKGAVLCLVHVNGVLISGSSDRSIRIWKFGQDFRGSLVILEGHCKPVKSLVAIPGVDYNLSVFSGSLDGEIRES